MKRSGVSSVGVLVCLVLLIAGAVLLYQANEEKALCDRQDAEFQKIEDASNGLSAASSRMFGSEYKHETIDRSDRSKQNMMFGIGAGGIGLGLLGLVIVAALGKRQTN